MHHKISRQRWMEYLDDNCGELINGLQVEWGLLEACVSKKIISYEMRQEIMSRQNPRDKADVLFCGLRKMNSDLYVTFIEIFIQIQPDLARKMTETLGVKISNQEKELDLTWIKSKPPNLSILDGGCQVTDSDHALVSDNASLHGASTEDKIPTILPCTDSPPQLDSMALDHSHTNWRGSQETTQHFKMSLTRPPQVNSSPSYDQPSHVTTISPLASSTSFASSDRFTYGDDVVQSLSLTVQKMQIKLNNIETMKEQKAMDSLLTEIKDDMDFRFKQQKGDIKTGFKELVTKDDMDSRFKKLKDDMDSRFKQLNNDMESRFKELKDDMESRFKELAYDMEYTKGGLKELKDDMDFTKCSLQKINDKLLDLSKEVDDLKINLTKEVDDLKRIVLFTNPDNDGSSLLIGDAMIKDISESNLQQTRSICLPDGKVSDFVRHLKEYADGCYNRITLCIGTNHCRSKPFQADGILQEYVDIIKIAKTKVAHPKLISVSSILPCVNCPWQGNIDEMNSQLQRVAQNYGVEFINNDMNFKCFDGRPITDYFKKDGISLKRLGVVRLAENLGIDLSTSVNRQDGGRVYCSVQ